MGTIHTGVHSLTWALAGEGQVTANQVLWLAVTCPSPGSAQVRHQSCSVIGQPIRARLWLTAPHRWITGVGNGPPGSATQAKVNPNAKININYIHQSSYHIESNIFIHKKRQEYSHMVVFVNMIKQKYAKNNLVIEITYESMVVNQVGWAHKHHAAQRGHCGTMCFHSFFFLQTYDACSKIYL